MSQPNWIGSGTAPQKSDTKRLVTAKLLGAIQNNLPAPSDANNPLQSDTLYRLRTKLVRAKAGLSSTTS